MADVSEVLSPSHPGSFLVIIEGGVLAWLIGGPLWDNVNPTVAVVGATTVFFTYARLYLIPRVNVIIGIVASVPWAIVIANLMKTGWDDDRFDVWLVAMAAFLISSIAHWTLASSTEA